MNNSGIGQPQSSGKQRNNNNISYTQQQQQNKGASSSKMMRKKEDSISGSGSGNNGGKKHRVFINKASNNQQQSTLYNSPIGVKPPPLFPQMQFTNTKDRFAPVIPDVVMEDILFRFLYNIPDNEKENQIRVCFHIELAHWFFLDFYCTDNTEVPDRVRGLIPCQQVGFGQFVRQVFNTCDYMEKWRPGVDQIVKEFNFYKSHVPTYGVIMLDPTLTYVLLVQGYYAQKNSWGFPKGKINEDEVPMGCALREAYEEVGFDATDHIKDPEKFRPLQHFFGDTLVRLFLATDVPMDHPFKPHLRNEIRKICWFSVRDLPKFPKDNPGCARLGKGFSANCFNSVVPFTKDICDFIEKERRERNKPKCTILKSEAGSENSAFQPVIPRASSQQKLAILSPNVTVLTRADEATTSSKSTVENLFKPLKPDPANQPTSFTGQSFLEHIGAAITSVEQNTSVANPLIPTNPAGVIGGESQYRRNKEIKHPKPVQPAIGPVVLVYEAPLEQSSPENSAPKETASNEIVDMLRSSISKVTTQEQQTPSTSAVCTTTTTAAIVVKKEVKSVKKKSAPSKQQPVEPMVDADAVKTEMQPTIQTFGQFVPTQVRRCEAWKKFTLDRSRLQHA